MARPNFAKDEDNKNNKFLRVLVAVLKAIIVIVLLLVLFLPVLLLTVTTLVPVYLWAPLVVIDISLIFVAFRLPSRRKGVAFMCLGFLVVALMAVAMSHVFAGTRPISGKNSIAKMEQVNLNGRKEWITIRGKDTAKPVLLYLGIGGPGAGGFPATFTSLSQLEDDFVVVNWDQPGTGKSYNAVDISKINTQMFVDDATALTKLLRKRFNQDKIYVFGLSWGTILGIKLVQQHPEMFHAYIGNGQMVNTTENDRYGYNLAIEISKDKGRNGDVETLKRNGPPPYTSDGLALKYAFYNDILFKYMESPTIPMIMALVPQLATEYSYIDRIKFDLGLYKSFAVLYPQLKDLDFTKQAQKLEVPVYFLVGKKDVNAVASIVERYYGVLEAPKKELIWLKSGHGATVDEIEDALVNRVLKGL